MQWNVLKPTELLKSKSKPSSLHLLLCEKKRFARLQKWKTTVDCRCQQTRLLSILGNNGQKGSIRIICCLKSLFFSNRNLNCCHALNLFLQTLTHILITLYDPELQLGDGKQDLTGMISQPSTGGDRSNPTNEQWPWKSHCLSYFSCPRRHFLIAQCFL